MSKLTRVGVWEHPDTSVSITHFDSRDIRSGETEDVFIQRHTDRLKLDPNFANATLSIILASDIPVDRSQRVDWSIKSGKVVVDSIKTAVRQAAKDAATNKKTALLGKLKIDEADFQTLKEALK